MIARRDWPGVEARFRTAFSFQEGVKEVGLLAVDASGTPHAQAFDGAVRTPPVKFQRSAGGFVLSEGEGLAWAQRAIEAEGSFRLIAALDIKPMLEARQRLFRSIVMLDLLVAGLCGLAAYVVLRRLGRPIEGLLALLRDSHGVPKPVPPSLAQAAGPEFQPVFAAFNIMVEGLQDRDRLRAEMAERNQAAALGRLAATIAHEVRNPLGGLATAVTTLRKFGADEEVRRQSLEFLARGIDSIDTLVTRTLNIYRPEDERRLTRDDFEDLRLLVAPAAAKRDVVIAFGLDLPPYFNVKASGVRQVMLNLLLNAVAASPPLGCVRLDARIEADHLVCLVSDEGQGMEHANVRKLLGQAPAEPSTRRIGIETVVAILGDLQARASVQGTDGGGTTIRIDIPIEVS